MKWNSSLCRFHVSRQIHPAALISRAKTRAGTIFDPLKLEAPGHENTTSEHESDKFIKRLKAPKNYLNALMKGTKVQETFPINKKANQGSLCYLCLT